MDYILGGGDDCERWLVGASEIAKKKVTLQKLLRFGLVNKFVGLRIEHCICCHLCRKCHYSVQWCHGWIWAFSSSIGLKSWILLVLSSISCNFYLGQSWDFTSCSASECAGDELNFDVRVVNDDNLLYSHTNKGNFFDHIRYLKRRQLQRTLELV